VIPLPNIIHEIFKENIKNYIDAYNPSYTALKALNHIVSCRTPQLGAAVYRCECGHESLVFHSCRDRHCPVCQNINNARWAEKQLASSLPVKYYHVVFTLPDMLNGFIMAHPKESYDALFQAASSALLKLCADSKYMGATPGFTAVLHTWGQTMQFHPHLHLILTAGGLSPDGARFIDKSDSNFLLPVKVLSRLFRGLFIDTLAKIKSTPLDLSLKNALYQSEFFCYLKEPFERSDNVVKYLARYANRVCISDSRVLAYDKAAGTVTFSYKDNKDAGRQKEMTLSCLEFMRRFLLHILPKRFMKIRHYGILQNRGKSARLGVCRRLLGSMAPLSVPKALRQMLCPDCAMPLIISDHLSAIQIRLKALQLHTGFLC
jgi:hypothetical protein